MLIPNMEALLCVGLLVFGSLGLFSLFAFTDSNALNSAKQPQHQMKEEDAA